MSDQVRTTCPYCGVGCGVLARRVNGEIEITGDPAHPANFGNLCSKANALADTLGSDDRLLYPQIQGRRESWDSALNHVSREFKRIIEQHGRDSVALYVSGQLLTEDYYVANKLMKGFIGSANIDTNSRLCMASAVAGHKRAFGEDVVPMCYEDLQLADLVVLVGSNTAWCHPVLFRRITEEKERRPGLKIVVIDPRRTPTCDVADLHVPIHAGSDVWLFNGLLAYLRRHGATDVRFVDTHTLGAQNALEVAETSAPDEESVAKLCGTDAACVAEFYRLFAATERVVTAFSQGVNQSSSGTDKVNSIINCHLLTGRIGRPGMGPFSLTGQPNAMGGREVGGMATTLAEHLDLENPSHRETAQRFWNSPRIADRPGLKAVEMFDAMHAGRIKAVWIMATNPVVSMPDADRVREALRRCELVVVSDCVEKTDTTAFAHVLLPAAAWGEKDGTVTNSERRISRQRSFLPLAGEAKPDWWMVAEVARRMGFAGAFDYASAHDVFDEHTRFSGVASRADCVAGGSRAFDISGLSGLTAAQFEELEPVQWPVSHKGGAGIQRLFANGRFMHPDGRARFVATVPRPPANGVDSEFPFALNTGRIRDQWHTMTRTGRSPRLVENLPEPFVDIHPQDALLTAVREGELARVTSRWGSMVARVRSSGEIARGSVFVPMHWNDAFASQARVGALVNAAVDPLSGEPEFKHTPVSVEPFVVDWYGFVLTRNSCSLLDVTWWARIRGESFVRYELAGRRVPSDWSARARRMLGVVSSNEDYIDYEDVSAGIYRAAHIVDGRLAACIYISSRASLPARGALSQLFSAPEIGRSERLALLAGRALSESEDSGPLVCSCFGVGRDTILRTIAREKLSDVRQVGLRLRAGSNCGSCLPEIRALIEASAATTPASASSAS